MTKNAIAKNNSNSKLFKITILGCVIFALGFFTSFHLLHAAPNSQELNYEDVHCLDWSRSALSEQPGVFDYQKVKCTDENGVSILEISGKHSDYVQLNLTEMEKAVLSTIPTTNEQQFEYVKKFNSQSSEYYESLVIGGKKVIG